MPLKNSYWWFYDQLKIACYRTIAKFGYDLVDIQAVQFRRNVRYWVVVKSHCSIEPQLWYWGKPSAGSAYALFEPRIKKGRSYSSSFHLELVLIFGVIGFCFAEQYLFFSSLGVFRLH